MFESFNETLKKRREARQLLRQELLKAATQRDFDERLQITLATLPTLICIVMLGPWRVLCTWCAAISKIVIDPFVILFETADHALLILWLTWVQLTARRNK